MKISFQGKNKKYIGITVLILAIFSLSVLSMQLQNRTVATAASSGLSNKKIGWGIKRNDDHEQPDVGKSNQKVLEDNNGICLGNTEKKYVYLTFDEGYEAGNTAQILETLKSNDVKACFFLTAHYINTEGDLVKQMIDEGHIVGNHTVNHKSMPSLDNEKLTSEVMDLHKTMYEKYNYEMKYLRPPMGEFSEKTLNMTNSLGYRTVMWSFAYQDWNNCGLQ